MNPLTFDQNSLKFSLRSGLNDVTIFAANRIADVDHRFAICLVINRASAAFNVQSAEKVSKQFFGLRHWRLAKSLYLPIKFANSGWLLPWSNTMSDVAGQSIEKWFARDFGGCNLECQSLMSRKRFLTRIILLLIKLFFCLFSQKICVQSNGNLMEIGW